ncbi:hypothetical protein GCM10023172_35500 [Hymenobacter ginsengisoli]|uniref:Uncharacterized protein n=1 Tax=Hymenobacter ginsengisoli TaxID=1051626 RepID=A0ABP8QMA4_9BACT|nr:MULTISPECIES: hypothetical protein [unclassified Hymenobacter]MBO2033128.1 hypothetical protein [Hymenobacter sp. BT559]
MKQLPASLGSLLTILRPVAGAALLLAALGPAASRPAPPYKGDPATKVDFTFSGAGHTNEQVHLRDIYPEVPAPHAVFYHEGMMQGVPGPLVELRTEKQGPKLWSMKLLLEGSPESASLRIASAEPALVYNGGEPKQQAFFGQLFLPPLKRGTLSAHFLPAPKGRLRGTFAGTLITDSGEEVTVRNGSFDLPRLPDIN